MDRGGPLLLTSSRGQAQSVHPPQHSPHRLPPHIPCPVGDAPPRCPSRAPARDRRRPFPPCTGTDDLPIEQRPSQQHNPRTAHHPVPAARAGVGSAPRPSCWRPSHVWGTQRATWAVSRLRWRRLMRRRATTYPAETTRAKSCRRSRRRQHPARVETTAEAGEDVGM